ncbi:hypothetical protein CFP56_023021 [Quercus suber]|uniref:Uncharacterized protein n=1 Tax=Quercus suber TaxID=58331 RepID=A0AAW0KAT0_QUESU
MEFLFQGKDMATGSFSNSLGDVDAQEPMASSTQMDFDVDLEELSKRKQIEKLAANLEPSFCMFIIFGHVCSFWAFDLMAVGVFYGDVEVAGSVVICVVNDYDDGIGYGSYGWKEIEG